MNNEIESDDLTISARRTESLDAPDITSLVNNETSKIFGRVNVARIIEKSNLAVTVVDEHNVVVGHAAFYDYPNCNLSNHWMEWIKQDYQQTKSDPINTLFLHYFVYKDEFAKGIMKEILRTVFHAVPMLQYIYLLIPIDVDIGDIFTDHFEAAEKIDQSDSIFEMLVCHRHNHCPMLHIREARIEDHDDLMPIFNQNNQHLTSIYGDYFLAELMEAQNDENKCIVADVDGVAVGFMSASTNIDINILNDNFELVVFNHCLKRIEKKKQVIKKAATRPASKVEEIEETGRASLSPTRKSTKTPGSRKGSPLKAASRKSKLSSIHLEQSDAEDTEPQVEYVTEVFDVESIFSIQLFCIDEKYEARSIDFLPAVFNLFESRDFAVITVPHTVAEFPLLHYFQRVSPKPCSTFTQELYLFNRNGLLTNFVVRPCVSSDTDKIKELTKDIKGHANVMSDLERYNSYRRDQDGVCIYSYVAEVMSQVVGVCIFRQENDIDYIRSHYNIEDYIYFCLYESSEHGHLHHFVLNPIFQHYSKYFLKEIFYQSKMSSFYYPIYPNFIEPKGVKNHSLATCLNDLVSVTPRRQVVYPVEELGENAPEKQLLQQKDPYALYHINRKLTLEPKVAINSRIVIVGASDVGLSALETLVYCPHLCFNNLTLVSYEDLFNNSDDVSNMFLPQCLNYNEKRRSLLSLKTWINVVQGKVTKLDRKSKNLIMEGNKKLPYDELLLCCGEQYNMAVPTGADVQMLFTTTEALDLKQQVYEGPHYSTVFDGVDLRSSSRLHDWIKNSYSTERVIVYGSSLESYTCIQGLLRSNVNPALISHVHPSTSKEPCFHDSNVEEVMNKQLIKLGVTSYHGYTLAQWHGNEDGNMTSASFTSDAKPLTLECQAFICLHKKTINYGAFKAINDSFLVFDGKLVIDSQYLTNDKHIRAAGTLTKYARRYFRDNWTHADCNSKEVGTKLAESLLQLFDPTLEPMESLDESKDVLLPVYKQPQISCALLPGDFHYLTISKSSTLLSLESSQNEGENGVELITGSALWENQPEYFKLHLNEHNTIDEIVCLSNKPMDIDNLQCVYGMHERYLNNMLQRYKEGLIHDFYSYFKETWCLAIYHDRFKDFRAEIRELFSRESTSELSLEERVRQMTMEDQVLTSDQLSHIKDLFIATQSKRKIEERLTCFLDYNKYHLPMYARPSLV